MPRDLPIDNGKLLINFDRDYQLRDIYYPHLGRENHADGRLHLPIQEDDTALVVWALWEHFSLYHDVEFIKPLYRPVIMRAAEFMLDFRDHGTGLPLPSHDLWQERLGVHTYTVAVVCAGLNAAANFADAFGEAEHADRYREAARRMREALTGQLFNADLNRFARYATRDDELRPTALPIIEWVAEHALPSGMLAEQVNPYANEPLTWSMSVSSSRCSTTSTA